MPAILKQRKFLATQIFEITDSSLKVQLKKPFSYFEFEYKFEELGTRVLRQKKPYVPALLSLIASLFFTVVVFFSFVDDSKQTPFYQVGICIGVSFFFVWPCYILQDNTVTLYLQDFKNITFLATLPSVVEVNNFLSLIKEAQKKYLINKYATANPYLTIEQIANNLQWLSNKEIITDAELAQFRSRLLPRPGGNLGIDFTINAN